MSTASHIAVILCWLMVYVTSVLLLILSFLSQHLSLLQIQMVALKVSSIVLYILLPAFGCPIFKDDSAFVMSEFVMLNISLVSSFFTYSYLSLYRFKFTEFIGAVPEQYYIPLTGLVLGVSLLIATTIFLLVETVFHGLITYQCLQICHFQIYLSMISANLLIVIFGP